jgi:CTP:molybdopterin cytidylyltransferase MocA
MHAIVMAAGEGRRMRPISERWPKPVLPIDGRPVVATLLRDLAAVGLDEVTVVTGHLAEQVETLLGDGSAFGTRIRYVRQPRPDGSADAVRRALRAPALVTTADQVFAPGTLERFLAEWGGAPGAVAARAGEPALDPRLAEAFADPARLTGAALWGLGEELVPYLDGLPGPPFELAEAFGRALAAGLEVRGVVVAGTRDLTHPVDLIRENFPYLS